MTYYANKKERGTALIVAMVILFMISILGISAMQSASVETQLASNALFKETTFQSAESAADRILTVPNVLADVICSDTPNETELPELNRSENQVTRAIVQYGGKAIANGYSINEKFSTQRFYVTGTSNIDDLSTSTTIVTGHIAFGASSGDSSC